MPAFRSKQDRSAEAGFVFRSELPAGSLRAMVPFFPQAILVKRSLDANMKADGGLLHYELVADLGTKTFTVDSSWADEASFNDWVGTAVHVKAMKKLGPVEGASFETETLTS